LFCLAGQLDLETEKRKRVETELLLEREKRLRSDTEHEIIVSRYKSILFATTQGLAKMWDAMNAERVQTLWFEPTREALTFDQPPTGNAGRDYQNWFANRILTQLDDNGFVEAVDSHRLMFLDGKAPDIATHT